MGDEHAHAEETVNYEEDVGEEEVAKEVGNPGGELEAMKAKLKEMEEEAAQLKSIQAGGSASADNTGAAAYGDATQADKSEADSRSVYVGNVDYACTPEELQLHFQSCGTVNRVTILTDKFGGPKGFAYIEFLEVDAVENAVLLNDTELKGRQIKVSAKRTNVPGMKRGRGRRGGFNAHAAGYGRGGYFPPAPYGPPRGRGGFNPGFAPRGRGRGGRGFHAPY